MLLNFHWPSGHPGSLGQRSGEPNSYWLLSARFSCLLLRHFLAGSGAGGAPGSTLSTMAEAGGVLFSLFSAGEARGGTESLEEGTEFPR